MAQERQIIAVFCGPPCSGKSTVSKALLELDDFRYFSRLEMDQLRLALYPHSHTITDRFNAYGKMHELAADILQNGAPGVLLDATYQPQEQRRAVQVLAERMNARLKILECSVDADKAVERFTNRLGGHAGIDLSEERVWELANDFPYFSGATRLETSREKLSDLLIKAAQAIRQSQQIDSDSWIAQCSVSAESELVTSPESPGPEMPKLNERSRRSALCELLRRRLVMFLTCGAISVAFVVLVKAGLDPHVEWIRRHGLTGEPAEWILVWVAISGLATGIAIAREQFISHSEAQRFKRIADAGTTPKLSLRGASPSNRDVYRRYQRRLRAADEWQQKRCKAECSTPPELNQESRLLIPDIPLWFVVSPRSEGFDVIIDSAPSRPMQKSLLEARAGLLGLDWSSYVAWRQKSIKEEYFGRYEEVGVRALGIDVDELERARVVRLSACPGRFTSYVLTELSANYRMEGRQGFELRQILEGPAWRRWDQGFAEYHLELQDIEEAGKTHEMLVSVQVGLTTSDGFLLLQRRSHEVQSATGGIGSSGAGNAKWKDFSFNTGSASLINSALREIREEIGWGPHPRDDTRNPFLGAAFNLLRGRDLNFYCYIHTERTLQEISDNLYHGSRYRKILQLLAPKWADDARDTWEIAHLIPIPVEKLPSDDSPNATLDALLADARHVRGLLKCLSASSKFRTVQEEWKQKRTRSLVGTLPKKL